MILKETDDDVQKEKKMEACSTENGKKYQDPGDNCEVDWMPNIIRIII